MSKKKQCEYCEIPEAEYVNHKSFKDIVFNHSGFEWIVQDLDNGDWYMMSDHVDNGVNKRPIEKCPICYRSLIPAVK